MKFAKILYYVAGIYSLVILTPLFFLYDRVGIMGPPAITHPEYFYGFIVVGLSFAVCFLIIAGNPSRLRPVMLATVIEKLGYGMASLWLFTGHRTSTQQMEFAFVDILFGVLFLFAYFKAGTE